MDYLNSVLIKPFSCQMNPEDFFESFRDPSYGKCYRFNSGKNMKGDTKEILNNKIAGRR